MGINPDWMGYLKYCASAGLGQFELDRIELRSRVELAKIRKTYKLHPRIDKQLEWMGALQKS
jgi:hypothetical protein